jgi:hypothetical protein
MKILFVSLLILTCCGCATIPFKATEHVPLKNVNPQEVIAKFSAMLPREFEVLSSIVFSYRFFSFLAIGYTRIDQPNASFTVSCINPAGIKLFEFSGSGDKLKRLFVMDELAKKGDVATAVAGDIKRIYLDRLPAQAATVKIEKYRMIFSQPLPKARLEYVFAGANKLLVEKNYYEDGKKIWSVFYYEYVTKNNKLYPSGIIFKHYRYHYKLISRLKEIRV